MPGTEFLDFENVEGIILIVATLSGTRDTSGHLVLDTGAGYLALDHPVAERLELLDDLFVPGSVDFADRALRRLRLGGLEIDQVSPVLVLDASVVRRVTDRAVLGLLGERALRGRSLLIDYQTSRVALLPAVADPASTPGASPAHAPRDANASALVERSRLSFGDLLTRRAHAIRFRLVGDGKMLVHARVALARSGGWSDSLHLILDTGATKCVFFEESLDRRVPTWKRWPSLAGLSAPTLLGNSEARVVRVPAIEISSTARSVTRTAVDAAVIRSPLSEALDRVVGAPVDGLLGYSFLRRYRVGIDYAREVVWLDPRPEPWDDRPHEYSHVGLQIERNGTAAEIVAIAGGSPAARAGIAAGDTLVGIDGALADRTDLTALARRLEGPPGSPVRVVVRHEGKERTYRLVRRRLL